MAHIDTAIGGTFVGTPKYPLVWATHTVHIHSQKNVLEQKSDRSKI